MYVSILAHAHVPICCTDNESFRVSKRAAAASADGQAAPSRITVVFYSSYVFIDKDAVMGKNVAVSAAVRLSRYLKRHEDMFIVVGNVRLCRI